MLSTTTSSEIEELKKRITQLEQLVQKQNKIITQTGKGVLQLQVDKQRENVQGFINPNPKQATKLAPTLPQYDTTDFATNDDIVQLVGELQIELNTIEERSIRRLVNANKSNPNDTLAPLPNADGEIPNLLTYDFFPKSLQDFINIDNLNLMKLASFYECLPPTMKDKEELDHFLNAKIENLEISKERSNDNEFSNDVLITDDQFEKLIRNYSKDQLDEVFNEVGRYLGLAARRGTNIW